MTDDTARRPSVRYVKIRGEVYINRDDIITWVPAAPGQELIWMELQMLGEFPR